MSVGLAAKASHKYSAYRSTSVSGNRSRTIDTFRLVKAFDEHAVAWATAACEEWSYPVVSEEWVAVLMARLPIGLQELIVEAVEDGTMNIVGGHRFTLAGLAAHKGPYALFSRSNHRSPAPNWEYFVQAAEYRRVSRAVEPRGLRVDFEDDLIDVSVYEEHRLTWCIEVKEKAGQLDPLLVGMRKIAPAVDMTLPDRGNDALRKAKYLMRHRPPYFSMVAIGKRLEFSVTYDADGFALTEDVVPLA
jgi:hypothetical protein